MNKLKLSLQSVRRLTDPLPVHQSQMVTNSSDSKSNSLCQEELDVGLLLSDGELPSVAPIPRSVPQKPFGASSANSTVVCPLWSGNSRSFIIVYFWVSFHTDAISPRPIVDLPLPGGGGSKPLPLLTPTNPTVDSPGGLGDGERGRLQQCCVGAEISSKSHLLSLADYALAARFPFTILTQYVFHKRNLKSL